MRVLIHADKEKSSKHKDEKQREFASLINYRRHNWENQLLYRSLKRRRLQAMPGSVSFSSKLRDV